MEERSYLFYPQYSIQFNPKQLKCDTLSGLNVLFLFLWECLCLFAFVSSLYILAVSVCIYSIMVQVNNLCQIVYLTFRVRSVQKAIGAIGFANKHRHNLGHKPDYFTNETTQLSNLKKSAKHFKADGKKHQQYTVKQLRK